MAAAGSTVESDTKQSIINETLYMEWKENKLTAEQANKKLNDKVGISFSNAIENGYFVDPVSTNRISGPDKKMSSTLIFNAIYEAAMYQKFTRNTRK